MTGLLLHAMRPLLILAAIAMAILTRMPGCGIFWLVLLGGSVMAASSAPKKSHGRDWTWATAGGWTATLLLPLSLLFARQPFTLFDSYYSVLTWMVALALVLNRNDADGNGVRGGCSCDAPVAERVGDAPSPGAKRPPNGVPVFSRDEGVAPTFCDGASQLRVAATAGFRLRMTTPADQPARRHWKALAMIWAFYGGLLWLVAAYQQNWTGQFYAGLVINLALLVVCRCGFRLGPVGIQTANTLMLLLVLVPLADRLAQPAEHREGKTEVAGSDYVYEVLKKDPQAFRRWWFRLCGQLEVLGADVFMPDPEHALPFRLRPGSEGSFFQSRIPINRRGFRGKEFAADKGGAYRIVALGESTTFGLTLTPEHRPWPELLEELIRQRVQPDRPVEVINAGIPRFTIEQNLQRLPAEILPLKPDMIISYHGFNGFQLFSEVLPPVFGKPLPVFKPRPVRLLAVLEFKLKMLYYTRRQNAKVVPRLPAVADLLKTRCAAAYLALIRAARTNHIQLVLANYSMSVNGASKPEVVEFYRAAFPALYWQIKANEMHSLLVKALTEQHPEVCFVDTHPHLDGDYGKFVDPMHFTAAGDRQMAETFFDGIRKIQEREFPGRGRETVP